MLRVYLVSILVILLGTSLAAGDISVGKKLARKCSVCHGKIGLSKDPEVPNLAGLSNLYIEKTLVDYQTGARNDRRMSLIAKGLSKEEIKDLAAWFSAIEVTAVAPDI